MSVEGDKTSDCYLLREYDSAILVPGGSHVSPLKAECFDGAETLAVNGAPVGANLQRWRSRSRMVRRAVFIFVGNRHTHTR
jgi:hypothetical protein